MSALLSQLESRECKAECAKNAPVTEAGPLIAFRVTIKNAKHEVRGFEAMGTHAVTTAAQHESLCEEGEYIEVMPLDKWYRELAKKFAAPLGKFDPRSKEYANGLAAQQNYIEKTRGAL